MDSYKMYKTINIGLGLRDTTCLVLVGLKGTDHPKMVSEFLNFKKERRDSEGYILPYEAYLVDDEAEIRDEYIKIAEYNSWLMIYDEDGRTADLDAEKIIIYKTDSNDCIIQLINEKYFSIVEKLEQF